MRPAEFDSLVSLHHPAVLRTAYRLLRSREDAWDATQEVFLRLFRNYERVNGDVRGWLHRVTVNVCNDHFRRRRSITQLALDNPDSAPGPECALRIKEQKHLILGALDILSDRERAAVVLCHIHGLSAREAAVLLNVEAGTIRSRTHSARVKLAHHLRNPPSVRDVSTASYCLQSTRFGD